jgi:hypothetical protein
MGEKMKGNIDYTSFDLLLPDTACAILALTAMKQRSTRQTSLSEPGSV